MSAKPITYSLVFQCVRPEIGIMAEYVASTPFPHFPKGGSLELLDCNPSSWDVFETIDQLMTVEDGSISCVSLVLIDSPVVENTGIIIRKKSGETVGPSETRFGRST